MILLYIYLLIGCALVLKFYPWEGRQYELFVAFLVTLCWPLAFYYAWKETSKAKKLHRKGGEGNSSTSDPGQTGEDEGKGGGA